MFRTVLKTGPAYLLELVGFALLAYAAWRVAETLGLAVAGAELVLIAQAARK